MHNVLFFLHSTDDSCADVFLTLYQPINHN